MSDSQSNSQFNEVLHNFLTQVPNPMSVTLTAKTHIDGQAVDQTMMSANIRFMLNRLNQKLFGVRFTRFKSIRVKVVPVIEVMKSGNRFHAHLTIEKPEHIEEEQFASLVKTCWSKTKIGYGRKDGTHPGVDIKSTFDIDGWTNYILKRRTKPTFDAVTKRSDLVVMNAVDWDNVYV